MFKVKYEDAKTKSMAYFTHFYSVSFVDFEQVNICYILMLDLQPMNSLFLRSPLENYEKQPQK